MAKPHNRKPADERKAEIIDAAIWLAGEMGPDRITTKMLADKVGISQAAIFRHYPTKSDIWWAVAERIGTMMGKKPSLVEGAVKLEPADQLRKLVVGHFAFLEKTPAMHSILFSHELQSENEKMRVFFAGLIETRQRHFSKLVGQAVSSGAFRDDLDPDDAAYLILALVQGLVLRWILNARQFDLVAQGNKLIDIQLDGFKP